MNGDSADQSDRATRDDLLEEFGRIAAGIGHIPRPYELRDADRYSPDDYVAEFGAWDNVIEAAELQPQRTDIIVETRRIQRELECTPTAGQFEENSYLERDDYKRYFDSWKDVLVAAEVFPSADEVSRAVRDLADDLGHVPNTSEFADETRYRRVDYLHHFDSWEETIDEAGVFPTKAELVEEVRRIKNDLGYEGLLSDSHAESRFPRSYYEYQFDSWDEALNAARVSPTKEELLSAFQRILKSEDTVPTQKRLLSKTVFRRQDYRRHFDSVNQAIKVALKNPDHIDPLTDVVLAKSKRDCLHELAEDLGHPPTEKYVRRQTDADADALLGRFEDWDLILEAAGMKPDVADPAKELAPEIAPLCDQLGHRPNVEEVRAYISDERLYTTTRGIRRALESANIPEERDLTPSHSLTRQKYEKGSDEIPSHTDLLAELNVIRSRTSGDLEEEFDNRSVIDERHYDLQFGSLSEAIDVLESIDTREFREPRERVEDVPGPILADSVEELADILDRPPLLEEVLFFGDASPSDFVRAFESWPQVTDAVGRLGSWSNEELLTELEYVGRQLGKPPTPTEMTEYGSPPTQCYLRRFGSWPKVLSLVGVDTDHVPEEYLGFRRTARLWDVTDRLVREEFGHRAALLDELYRLAFELGGKPTADDIRNYSPYSTTTFDSAFGSVADSLDTLEGPFEYGGTPSTDPTESGLLEELRNVSEQSTEEILPQDICLHSSYSPGTFLGVFGSLKGALEEADLPTVHLHGQTATYGDIWHSDHQVKTGILREIQRITSKDGEPPTMVRISTVDGIDQNVIYRYFDSWDGAREAAGVISSSRSVDIDREHGTTDNPEFVNDLMSEISDMMDEPTD